MIKAAALALLAGGILLTIFGVNAMTSASSDISRFFTGAPTHRAKWILVGGIVMLVAGLAGLLPVFRGKTEDRADRSARRKRQPAARNF